MKEFQTEYDLTPTEIRLKLSGNHYLLREAPEDVACAFRNAQTAAARFNEHGKIAGFDGGAEVQQILVAGCLFDLALDAEGRELGRRPVPRQTVRGWPTRVVKALYEKAREISDLKDEGETEEELTKTIADAQEKLAKLRGSKEEASKNGQAAGTGTSS